MGNGACGMVSGDQSSEGDRQRVDEAIGDPAVGVGVTNGQAGALFNVLVEQIDRLIRGGSRNLAWFMRTGALASSKCADSGDHQVLGW